MKKSSESSSRKAFTLQFSPQAKADLEALGITTRKAIGRKLAYYMESGQPLSFSKPLINYALGSRRFRIGGYRVIFDVEGQTIFVLRVRNRKDLY